MTDDDLFDMKKSKFTNYCSSPDYVSATFGSSVMAQTSPRIDANANEAVNSTVC
jgi:hypothetical protein